MTQYRRLPVIVDAFQWTGGPDQLEDPEWIVEAIKNGDVSISTSLKRFPKLEIREAEYSSFHSAGTWVVRDANGDISAVSPKDFAKLYEEVPNASVG